MVCCQHVCTQQSTLPFYPILVKLTSTETPLPVCCAQAWGWVQEMYGFTFALWLGGIKHVDLFLHMMAQPPWDNKLNMAPNKPFYILHYTYGMDYKLTGACV